MVDKKKRSILMVDEQFHDLFSRESQRLGVSHPDLSRLIVSNSFQNGKFVLRKKKKGKRGLLFDLESDDDIFNMFK